jgi:hypothetical protein
MGMMNAGGTGKITYAMKGKLSGKGFSAHRFSTKGDFDMPTGAARENIGE